MSGGAGRVEDLPALALALERIRALGAQQLVVRLEALDATAHCDARWYARQVEPGDHGRHRAGGHERVGTTVVEDVLVLGRPQVAVDRGVVQPRTLRGPGNFEVG